MIAWRIATDTPSYQADDLSGTGAKLSGGRWNSEGIAVVYAAQSRALAALQTRVHLNTSSLPLNHYLVQIDIEDPVWEGRDAFNPNDKALTGWDATPAGQVSIQFGNQWLRGMTTAVLVVPSVIVPEEWVILINPVHPDASAIDALKERKWLYDPRVKKAS